MNQDVNVVPKHSVASKRVFKFHNVNQDNIFGSRKTRREENKTKIIISTPSIEEQLRRRKTQQILQQFVPIKQKSLENKAILAPVQPQIISARCKEARRESEPGSGLRLVNIASLQEPSDLGKSENIGLHQASSISSKVPQESPLDLSNQDGPLDLSTKPDGRNSNSPAPASPEPSSPPAPPSGNQPLQFLLLKNVPATPTTSSFMNLLPSSVPPGGLIIPNLRENQRTERVEQSLKTEISESAKIKKPQSLQMVFSDGRVVQVLPRKTGKQERISDSKERRHSPSSSSSPFSEVRPRKDPNQMS